MPSVPHHVHGQPRKNSELFERLMEFYRTRIVRLLRRVNTIDLRKRALCNTSTWIVIWACVVFIYGLVSYTTRHGATGPLVAIGSIRSYARVPWGDGFAKSSDFTSDEISTMLYHNKDTNTTVDIHDLIAVLLRDVGEEQNGRTCACATEFGVRRRLLTVANEDGSTAVYFNCQHTPVATDREMTLVMESQEMLHTAGDSNINVPVWRRNSLRMTCKDTMFGNLLVRLSGPRAWCVEACLDLDMGVRIYDRYDRAYSTSVS